MFENMTPESIKRDILSNVGMDIDTREGSFVSDMISPVVLELWKCYQSLDAIVPVVYVDESSGIYIDKRCAEYGIARKAGTRASAAMSFAGTAGTEIPAGAVFVTASGLEFELQEAVVLSDTGGAGTVTAAALGDAYNVGVGEITQMITAIPGLERWENAAAAGGTDPESDAALVRRLYDYLQKPATSGNVYHYAQWALETDGVGDVKVTPLWNGAGTVKVLLVGPDKGPVDGDVVRACAAHIEEARPIGATVTVKSAQGLDIHVSAVVTVDSSTTKQAVQAELASKLDSYLKSIAFAQCTLLYNRVAFLLLDIQGVVDYTSLTVNGGTDNIAIGPGQVPVLGEVTVQ